MDRLNRFLRMHELENIETVIYDCSKLDQMNVKIPQLRWNIIINFIRHPGTDFQDPKVENRVRSGWPQNWLVFESVIWVLLSQVKTGP